MLGGVQTVRDRAVILRRAPLGEADWLATLLTENHGKIRAAAKGARRPTSRLTGFLEPFTVVSCQIDFRPRLPIVSQVVHELLIDGVAGRPTVYRALHVFIEVIDKATFFDHVQPALFVYVCEAIGRLVAGDRPLSLAQELVAAARQLGVGPQVERCAQCGRRLCETDTLAWSISDGGLIHAVGPALTLGEAKLIRSVVLNRLPDNYRVSSALTRRVERYLTNHIAHAIDCALVAPGLDDGRCLV